MCRRRQRTGLPGKPGATTWIGTAWRGLGHAAVQLRLARDTAIRNIRPERDGCELGHHVV